MKIELSHGSGGRETAALINGIFLEAFGRQTGNGAQDAAVLQTTGRLAFTTDSFVVKPLFFPGGDIGRLAVCGTVNDLLTAGAVPRYLSASFILEEGLDYEVLRRVAGSMAEAAVEAGVLIVTGDTKVVSGEGGLYITTSGIGELTGNAVTFAAVEPGDALIVTGTIGNHHACIMSARMGIENSIKSDAAPLCAMVSRLMDKSVPIHGMRDVTRGGLATVLWEISKQWAIGAVIEESSLPVSGEVEGLCSVLGMDPLYMGNEGVMLLAVPSEHATVAVDIIRSVPYGGNAACIGRFDREAVVRMRTKIGGTRMIGPLSGESLPRIC